MAYAGEDNSSDFTAFPAGGRGDDFNGFGLFAAFWTSSAFNRVGSNDYSSLYALQSDTSYILTEFLRSGYSCRCIKK